jgi:hypothetical protein
VNDVLKPHDAAVGRYHPVLELVVGCAGAVSRAVLDDPLAVVSANAIDPETRTIPFLHGVTE